MNHRVAADPDALVRVVHHSRGRLRLRVSDADGETMAEAMRSVQGIRSAAWSPRTRGLLVLYDPDSVTADAILEAVADHADLGEEAVGWDDSPRPAAPPTVATAISGPVSEIEQRVRRSTHGLLGLGVIIPAVLTLWAVSEIVRGRVTPLSWRSALWYAHGLFRDYNNPHA